jgi:hypothetical protein
VIGIDSLAKRCRRSTLKWMSSNTGSGHRVVRPRLAKLPVGLCGFGDGAKLAERGETAIGGRIPVNPSDGLESKGHPIAATGLGQLFELVPSCAASAGNARWKTHGTPSRRTAAEPSA